MATKFHKFRGTCKWAKIQEPVFKFQSVSEKETTIDLYLDEESWTEYEASGCRAKRREDEDGEYIKLKRPEVSLFKGAEKYNGPPMVIDENDEVIEDLVGNGSDVTVKVSVYDTKYGKGTRIEAVKVHTLVEYESDGDVQVNGEGDVKFKF